MKNVDPPHILPTLFSKQKRPHPQNWMSFIYTPPKILENSLYPPQKIFTPPVPSGCF